MQNDCKVKVDEHYGEYASDILEGKAEAENFDSTRETVPTKKCLLIGASNCKRLDLDKNEFVDTSISGSTFAGIDDNLASAEQAGKEIDTIVISLGTHDVSRNKQGA